jgi:capsular polysaccharide biosynthesis protein
LAGAEFHNHYAHLFCDVLPRLKLFEEAGLADQVPALLPPPSHGFAGEAWQKIGLTGNGSQRWDDGCWQLDGLYFASSFKKFCSWTPESAAWVRAKWASELIDRPVGKKVFYISRSAGPRPILNEQEIILSLQSYDVTVVQTEKLALQEQIDLFADAGLIVGPHGAGIQNALWAPRGCRVLELVNARYFSGVYWTLAESLNQPYGLVAGISAAGRDPLQEGYTCDPRLVRQAIDRLVAAT